MWIGFGFGAGVNLGSSGLMTPNFGGSIGLSTPLPLPGTRLPSFVGSAIWPGGFGREGRPVFGFGLPGFFVIGPFVIGDLPKPGATGRDTIGFLGCTLMGDLPKFPLPGFKLVEGRVVFPTLGSRPEFPNDGRPIEVLLIFGRDEEKLG